MFVVKQTANVTGQ